MLEKAKDYVTSCTTQYNALEMTSEFTEFFNV